MTFDNITSPWDWFTLRAPSPNPCFCNICFWEGGSFANPPDSEGAACPDCGSIARDRFLFYCFLSRTPSAKYRVLETSPRLGPDYRGAMARWFGYLASDYDLRSHKADLQLDLQALELPDDSFDIVLTPHVLEHVPNTRQALSELYRVLKPRGRMYLQVPIYQGWTTPPPRPEYHADNTLVMWRFGWDLTDTLREKGFRTRVLCTEGFFRHVRNGATYWPDPTSDSYDLESILSAVNPEDLLPVASDEQTRSLSFFPSYMFQTWECEKVA